VEVKALLATTTTPEVVARVEIWEAAIDVTRQGKYR